jgi:GNAT superfamily N-acetyltransferase
MLKTLVLSGDNLLDRNGDIIEFLAKATEGREPLPTASACWRWRYSEAQAGKGFVALVVDPSKRDSIVGHSAVGMLKCFFGGQEILVGASGGLFVAPDYRRSGAYHMLRNAEDDTGRSRGLAALLAIPGPMATPVSLMYGFRIEREYEFAIQAPTFIRRDILKKPMSAIGQAGLHVLGTIVRRNLKCASVDVKQLDVFGIETDALWKHVANEQPGTIKDAGYLSWRYANRPNTSFIALMAFRRAKPVGLCIIEWHDDQPRHAWIAELLVNRVDIDVAMAMLNEAEKHAAKLGVYRLTVLADGVSTMGFLANKRGYLRTEARPLMFKFLEDDFRMKYSGPWRYSMGDYMAGMRMI